MAETTAIEWADHTFNPWIGCTKVSPACDHCYAETLAKRYGWAKWGAGEPRSRTTPANWRKPIAWDKAAEKAGVRRRVFCASLADVFDAEVSFGWRDDLMDLIRLTPFLDWLLLTKRPQVAKKFFDSYDLGIPPNVWLGTTVEDQKTADLRIPILLSIPARVRFLSCEPLLGPVDLGWALSRNPLEIAAGFLNRGHFSPGLETLRPLSWVIAGGESGPKARPSHPDWFRALRDQCQDARVPFFFKQWGEWVPAAKKLGSAYYKQATVLPDGSVREWQTDFPEVRLVHPEMCAMACMGQKRSGAEIDGREWRQFPAPSGAER